MEHSTRLCLVCGEALVKNKFISKTQWGKQKYCSSPCRAKAVGRSKAGSRDTLEIREKKAASKRGPLNPWYGKKQPPEMVAKRVISLKGKTANEKHIFWKGDDAKNHSMHQWLNRHYPKSGKCERCGKTEGMMHYANLMGHIYTRNRSDYEELCVPCHQTLDNRPRDHDTGRFLPMGK